MGVQLTYPTSGTPLSRQCHQALSLCGRQEEYLSTLPGSSGRLCEDTEYALWAVQQTAAVLDADAGFILLGRTFKL